MNVLDTVGTNEEKILKKLETLGVASPARLVAETRIHPRDFREAVSNLREKGLVLERNTRTSVGGKLLTVSSRGRELIHNNQALIAH